MSLDDDDDDANVIPIYGRIKRKRKTIVHKT